MAPPTVVPCPPMYLVRECTTMCAPCSKGRQRKGVGTVLSTMSGTPWASAISAQRATSTTLPAGLPIDSQNSARVLPSMSSGMRSKSSAATKRVSMPWRGKVCANRL